MYNKIFNPVSFCILNVPWVDGFLRFELYLSTVQPTLVGTGYNGKYCHGAIRSKRAQSVKGLPTKDLVCGIYGLKIPLDTLNKSRLYTIYRGMVQV